VLTVHAAAQALHHGRGELTDGRWMPCHEVPARAAMVLAAVQAAGLGPVVEPVDRGRGPIERVHDPLLVEFLASAHALWAASGRCGDVLPMTWPMRGLRDREPAAIEGRPGFWCFDAGTPIGPGTWPAAYASAQAALDGAARLADGERSVFALCRPPGHHAARDVYGGYCYLNNAAIAAQALLDRGAGRVAVLDIDYHHGNGTQAIFWERGDVLVVSIHADPAHEYPFFLGFADERGAGPGEGTTLNLPLPLGTRAPTWMAALDAACARIAAYAPGALIVSLGVDTFALDPISHFKLQRADYPPIGRRIGALRLPTLVVMEGGYAVEAIGANVVGVLTGLLDAG
jgi:acetoin utilization deacetylase AcuC-like enzyme